MDFGTYLYKMVRLKKLHEILGDIDGKEIIDVEWVSCPSAFY